METSDSTDSGPSSLHQPSTRSVPYRILKLVCVFLVCGLLTLALVVSKGSTLFLVAQLGPSHPSPSCSTPSCDKFFQTVEQEDPTSAWLWCLLAALLLPELLTLLKSGYTVATQHTERPPLLHILVNIKITPLKQIIVFRFTAVKK